MVSLLKFLSEKVLSNIETNIETLIIKVPFILYWAGPFVSLVVLVISTLYYYNKYTKKKCNKHKKKIDKYFDDQAHIPMAEYVTPDAEYTENVMCSDAEYAEQIQLQEALMASILPTDIANTASSSVHTQTKKSSKVFCEICLEYKLSSEMFKNDECTHSFCYDCTTGHIMAKIDDKVETITCPSLNCNSTLKYDDCRKMIPKDALVKWDEALCLSLIPESQKLYCPFHDCSSVLVNDSGEVLRNISCPACKRPFCAQCRVPWHSEFTCKEFQKLNAKKGGKKDDDMIVKSLAMKKNWQKCPECKMYVEKTEGCLHITCRCKYEFCYRCGLKWDGSHYHCKPRFFSI